MTSLVISISCVTLGSIVGFKGRHYLFAIMLVMLGAYELSGPILYLGVDDINVLNALQIFAGYAFDDAIGSFSRALAVFFLLFIATYVLVGYLTIHRPEPTRRAIFSRELVVLPPAVLAFGIVSVLTHAGESRLEDYAGVVTETTRFFTYGNLLLVTCAALLISRLWSRNWRHAILIAICLAPQITETFIAGRRQWFAPTALLVLLILFYSRIRYKLLWAGTLSLAVGMFFAIQFSLREEIQEGITAFETESPLYAIGAPQIGEFVAIGSTSFYAWNVVVLGQNSPSWGVHWAFHLLNAFPYIKFGDILYPQYANELYGLYNEVAPWGGLAMLGDAIIGLGSLGVPLLGILLGVFCRIAHQSLSTVLRSPGIPADAKSVYVVSIIATLVPKYRSGIGDVVQTFVTFSLLYWAMVLLGYLVVAAPLRTIRNELPSRTS